MTAIHFLLRPTKDALTSGEETPEDPALTVLDRFARLHVLLEDRDGACPVGWFHAIRVIPTPVADENTIVVLAVDLIQIEGNQVEK